ncbi:hypothetical protein ABZW18_25930 [Streptomyces sp. NPDC004647]|uniref:hypothetical protein n=1 Tax=Streptomyces sp. NPDC004647 TaxID=3154671 RepID=UPI0033B20D64
MSGGERLWVTGRYGLTRARVLSLLAAHGVRVRLHGVAVNAERVVEYAELRSSGVGHEEIAARFGVSPGGLYRAIRKHREASLSPHPP